MKPARGFVISTLLYLVIMVITAALFISFGYKLIFKEDTSQPPSSQTPPDVQNQKADTVDQTANWKTYISTDKTYSFKYPSDLIIKEIDSSSLFTQEQIKAISIEPLKPREADFANWFTLIISVENNIYRISDTNQLIENYIKTLGTGIEAKTVTDKIYKNLKPYQNGNVEGIYTVLGWDYDYVTVFQLKNESIYTYDITGDEGSMPNDSRLRLFDQILSTFKFTE